MQPAHSISSVGSFTVLKTDNGQHSARQWARVTVGQIVQIDAAATPERAAQINAMRHHMVEAIEPLFRHPPDALAAIAVARDMLAEILAIARGTPWEANFCIQENRDAIQLLLARNLNTVARQ